ncbi:MAG: 23S rRNA (pseudouridine(1915)-N(3))-methyltransferase RlmH [Acidobacteria bacterium]|nr:23S rRNA (pseudouridine(1915)-N(3))-methyltransferase RlmH [Acidobacteriota bacterium]
MRLRILWVGRTKNTSIRALCTDYAGRLGHFLGCEIIETRDLARSRSLHGQALLSAEAEEIERYLPEGCRMIVLDAAGKQMSSPELARYLEDELTRGTRALTFVIGSPEGLDRRIRERARLRLSLGKMTWTHEMCRVLLLEQLYRAMCIIRNIPYHK